MSGCTLHRNTLSDDTANLGMFDYQTNILTHLPPTSTCSGGGAGSNLCSNYAYGLRKAVDDIGPDANVMLHRSWRSSGCAPNNFELAFVDQMDYPDTLPTPDALTLMRLNLDSDMQSYSTRNSIINQQSREFDCSAYYAFPKTWYDGYSGWDAIGTGISTRLWDSSYEVARYNGTKSDPVSANSFGSYGVITTSS
jgi:hypothetical protein